jgi:hypothetical protein
VNGSTRLSLCGSCLFARDVQGRRGQIYKLCRNENVAAKYPAQPVLACGGFKHVDGEAGAKIDAV